MNSRDSYQKLVSNNGLVFKDLLRHNSLLFLTTTDGRLAVYQPTGKLVSLIEPSQTGGALPEIWDASLDGKHIVFVSKEGDLHALELG